MQAEGAGLLLLMLWLLLTLEQGVVVDTAIVEEGVFGALIVNTTVREQPVIINGVDVLAELKDMNDKFQDLKASLQTVQASAMDEQEDKRNEDGWREGPHACADSPPRPGTKCNTNIADGGTRPWTLAARFANDGVATWTWDNCGLWSNTELLPEFGCGRLQRRIIPDSWRRSPLFSGQRRVDHV